MKWSTEPVVILEAVRTAILLGVAFGLPVSVEQLAAIMAAVGASLALVLRGTVSSPAKAAELLATHPPLPAPPKVPEL